nr:tyrosine-type recombinase/integrase [Parabacteroides sp. HGS0025]
MFLFVFQKSFHLARHTWATEALRQNIPVAVISQALGHTSEKTTRIYLAQLDQSVLNKANEAVTKEVGDSIMKRA